MTIFVLKNEGYDFFKEKKITNRQIEIITAFINTTTHKDSAEKLFICLKTVKQHFYNIYKKLNVKNNIQLIILVYDLYERVKVENKNELPRGENEKK